MQIKQLPLLFSANFMLADVLEYPQYNMKSNTISMLAYVQASQIVYGA